ncbi:type IV secretory system conjugative DNA transfer family protein [Streptacidiphilus jiangxiensis]|uniref:type IV secretory system conjugative DNA transfer family protein n=1 Tax=Streptacidiphilus jiangxiensis TaxID=235985 RepID=UPI0005AA4ED3|nr:type IV secretory system conjugative DNA transfer family protein [Streptacidiphilus jiangxiensis]
MPKTASAPSTSSSATPGTDLALALLIGAATVLAAFGSLAWTLGNAAAWFTHTPRAAFAPIAAVLHPKQLWPHLTSGWLLAATRIAPGLLLLVLAAAVLALWMRWRSRRGSKGLAGAAELSALLAKDTAAKAKGLRPSLALVKSAQLDPDETGLLVGNLPAGQEVRASWEDVLLAIMAPRSGKTSGLAIPAILRAPGAVLLTSNKAGGDAWSATFDARARLGRVWTLDPQQIAHATREMWWDVLADARDLGGARRLAGHFVAASVDESNAGDFWSTAAANTLSALFLAAARNNRPITDVLAWLASPSDRTPIDLLRDAGFPAVASQLQGTVAGAVETRDGIYETARQYAACLLDPNIAAWVTPQDDLPQFRPEKFVHAKDTLYLLSKDGGGSASALIAAAADAVMRAAVRAAELAGGRLDPPLLAILDEAANVCKISDLPDLYSHLGSRGVIPITILQSYRQGVRVWGESGMDALWSAATVKVIGSGIDDADFADKLSRLVGEHDVETVSISVSDGSRSTSTSMRQERILAPDQIRALPKGKALLLATGIRAALLDLRPWYREPDAGPLAKASSEATAAITARALAKVTGGEA